MKCIYVIIWIFGLSVSCRAQNDCVQLRAQNKLFREKRYYFHISQCTTMKFDNGIVYHVPEIIAFANDSIQIVNLGIYADSLDHIISYPVSSIVWINRDGIPRKKVRSNYYDFEVVNCGEE